MCALSLSKLPAEATLNCDADRLRGEEVQEQEPKLAWP